jgi:hypothetical protein
VCPFVDVKPAVHLRLPSDNAKIHFLCTYRRCTRDAEAFDDTAFLGLARTAKRDLYRLSLFAKHLEPDEHSVALLPISGGTLIVTNHRLLVMRAHLDVHGAWNVQQFQGYAVDRSVERDSVRSIDHSVETAEDQSGNQRLEDRIVLTTPTGLEEILVSRGPEATLSEEDFALLRDAILGAQPK